MQNSNIKTEEEAESIEAASVEANLRLLLTMRKYQLKKKLLSKLLSKQTALQKKKKCELKKKKKKKLEADLLKSDKMHAKIKFIKKKLNK